MPDQATQHELLVTEHKKSSFVATLRISVFTVLIFLILLSAFWIASNPETINQALGYKPITGREAQEKIVAEQNNVESLDSDLRRLASALVEAKAFSDKLAKAGGRPVPITTTLGEVRDLGFGGSSEIAIGIDDDDLRDLRREDVRIEGLAPTDSLSALFEDGKENTPWTRAGPDRVEVNFIDFKTVVWVEFPSFGLNTTNLASSDFQLTDVVIPTGVSG